MDFPPFNLPRTDLQIIFTKHNFDAKLLLLFALHAIIEVCELSKRGLAQD